MFIKGFLGRIALGALVAAAAIGANIRAEANQSSVAVDLDDYVFRPSVIEVTAGSAQFQLSNVGVKRHNFIVSGNGVMQSSEEVSSGDSVLFSADLQPGTYQVFCDISDHLERGMEATLIVRAPAEADSAPAEVGQAQ